MATIQEQIDALTAAIATGAKTVSYADRSVTYHSLEEMQNALTLLEGKLVPEGGGNRTTFAVMSRD